MKNRLTQLLDGHGPGLHALLLRLTLNGDAAKELFQELFVRLAASAGFAAAEDYPAFAFRSAINLAHDWRRQRRHHPPPAPLPAQLVDPSGSPAVLADELARVLDAVGRLNQAARDAICLRYLRQMSYEEVGRAIGRTGHQARALCHAGIVRLRRMLQEQRRVDRVTP